MAISKIPVVAGTKTLTRGSIVSGNASGEPAALAIGSNNQVLKSNGTDAVWGTDAGGAALTGSTNNTVVTVTGANAIQGEANLTYDGTQLVLTDGTEGTDNLLVKTTADGSISMALEKSDLKYDLGLDHNNDGSQNFYIRERTKNGGTTNAVRMMINSAGIVMINTTSTLDDYAKFQVLGGSSIPVAIFRVGTNGETVGFRNAAGSNVGSIEINSSSTAYQTSSDYRLKENETPITDGITRLKTLKPYRFNFKADNDADGNPTQTVDGFFAHEVTAVPEAISGTKDEMKPEVLYVDGDDIPEDKNIGDVKRATEPKHQSIDQSKLVPLLVAAVQELTAKVEALENA